MLKTQSLRVMVVVVVLICTVVVCSAQTKTGTPPFRSFGGGPDVINLGNLNVHYSIPVFSRAGRGGMSFSYAFAYDNQVWVPITAGSTTAWLPGGGGLTRDLAAAVGVIQATITPGHCRDPYNGGWDDFDHVNFSYYTDSGATVHPFPFTPLVDDNICGGNTTATVTTTDGSGMSIFLSGAAISATVTLASGQKIVPLVIGGSGSGGTQTDTNGNQITTSSSNGVTSFYDTLSTATPVLQISGTAPSNVSYKYYSPAGTQQSVVVSYAPYTMRTNFGCLSINEYGATATNLVDRVTLADGSYYHFSYEVTPGDTNTPHHVTGRLSSITLPTGGTISYAYTGGNNGIMCSDGSVAGFQRTTPDGMWQYSRTGTAPAYTTTVTSPTDPLSGQSNQTKIQFQGDFETQKDVYNGAIGGTPIETVITCYNGNGVSNPSSCATTPVATPFLQITQFTSYNGGPQARLDKFYDGNGNVTEKDEYDFGATTLTRKTSVTYAALGNNILGLPASIKVTDASSNLKAQTTFAYDETTPVSSGITTNHISVSGSRGNLTTYTNYTTSSATLVKKLRYYDTGSVYQVTDVNNGVTTHSYGSCAGAFTTSVTLPVTGLSRSMAWNCSGGVMTSLTDENSKTTYTDYNDPYFWRPSDTKDALLNQTALAYTGLTRMESTLNFNGTSSTVDSLSIKDGLGRVAYSQHEQAQASANYDSVKQTYDALGRPYQVTMPYQGAAGADPPQGVAVMTSYYDAMNRMTKRIDGGGGIVNMTYNQNDVLQEAAPAPTGELTKRKELEYDGLARLKSVCEITGGPSHGPCAQATGGYSGYLTTYTYNAAPNLPVNFSSLTVSQNSQSGGGTSQTRTFIYDMLGRLLSETNPETSNTAYAYTYDTDATCGSSSGDLVKRVDANGNVTCYAYDKLHRITSVTYPSGPNASNTAKKYFVYDTATVNGTAMVNAKGRLAEAYTCTTCPGTKITDLGFSYSARGETTDAYESTLHSGGYYHLTASYFTHGLLNALAGLSVAGLPTIYYGGTNDPLGLDGEGRILKVTAASGTTPIAQGVVYTNSGTTQPIGSLTGVTLGSGDSDTFSYDPATGRMNHYYFNIGATPQTVQGDLTWNANGTLGQFKVSHDPFDATNIQTCNYGYDDLARVTSANCGTAWNQTFSPDPFGNASKTGTITFQPGYDQTKNWFQSLPGLSYDTNGNLKNDSFHTYGWDAENRLLSVDTVNLTFDALGRMVEQVRGSSYTQIVYSPGGAKLALMNGQTLQKAFVPLPGGTTAVYNSTGIAYYRHTDWLGSSRFASTPSRTKYFDVAYAPYGEDYADSGTLDLNFTGQNQDTVSGLYDFLYREYHPVSGRWIQPDPAGVGAADPSNPQTWNRYAYVTNMPLNQVDPLGLLSHCADLGYYLCHHPELSLLGIAFAPGGFWGGGDFWYQNDFLPGEDSINFPLPPLPTVVVQTIVAAITGNWKALIGTALDAASQDLWNQVNKPGNCNPICEGGWDDAKHLWHAWDKIKDWADKGECFVAAKLCKDSTIANVEGDNVNKDPMKILWDYDACVAQAQAAGRPPVCSDAGWNKVQRSGWFQNEACHKTQECLLGLTTPQ